MSAQPDTMRYKLVPSRRPVLFVVGLAEADRIAREIAAEVEAGVAVCECPEDNPMHGFRRLYVVPAPKKPKTKR